jgi:hypothetical protein
MTEPHRHQTFDAADCDRVEKYPAPHAFDTSAF